MSNSGMAFGISQTSPLGELQISIQKIGDRADISNIEFTIEQTHATDAFGNLKALDTAAYQAKAVTDQAGKAVFSGIPYGRYRVILDAPNRSEIRKQTMDVDVLSPTTLLQPKIWSPSLVTEAGLEQNDLSIYPITNPLPLARTQKMVSLIRTVLPPDIQETVQVDGASVPRYTGIRITDLSDPTLIYVPDSIVLYTQSGTVLRFGIDYTLSADGRVVNILPAGILKLKPLEELFLSMEKTLHESAAVDTVLESFALIEYLEQGGNVLSVHSAKTYAVVLPMIEVKTHALRLRKTDHQNQDLLLEGAQFSLYRKTAEKDQLISTQNTNTKGEALWIELEPAEYYVLEKKAPQGYKRYEEAIPVLFQADETEKTIIIPNQKRTDLLAQTGAGSSIPLLLGALIMAFIGWILLRQRGGDHENDT